MIRASVIGATGYAGEELTRLLLMHPEVEVTALGSKSYAGERMSSVYPNFRGITGLTLREPDLKAFAEESDVVFLALPHGIASREVTEGVLEEAVVIDLGADFRLADHTVYERWYGVRHEGVGLLPKAVYGLPELHRDKIRSARLIANPGCYTTASILAMAPLVRDGAIDLDSIIVDAGSGVTGAGRGLKTANLFSEVDEDLKAYGVAGHRHTPEIEQEYSRLAGRPVTINFTPHLIPMQRGILATCYADLKEPGAVKLDDIKELYGSFYEGEPFVRLWGSGTPQTKYVKGSNYIDIGFAKDERTGRVIVISAIDNLLKGAAGQALENMNIVFGLKETAGLGMIPDCPI